MGKPNFSDEFKRDAVARSGRDRFEGDIGRKHCESSLNQ